MAVFVSALMQYGGNALVVGVFLLLGGDDFRGREYFQNMAVYDRDRPPGR